MPFINVTLSIAEPVNSSVETAVPINVLPLYTCIPVKPGMRDKSKLCDILLLA